MANFERVEDVGTWTYHNNVVSSVLARMSDNEEANHQNKPRTCNQWESTYKITGQGTSELSGEFQKIAHLKPEYTVLLFGVVIVDSDEFAIGEADSSSQHIFFPTGLGIGPFLRPPIVVLSPSAFSVPDANSGRSWQTADLTAATVHTSPDDWLLAQIGQPVTASLLDNLKAGLQFGFRIAGFDDVDSTPPAANTNYYVFWHAIGSIAAYN